MGGPIDEWLMQFMTEFEGKSFVNISKGDLDLGDLSDNSKNEKEEKEKLQVEFKPLIDKFKEALGSSVQDVRMTLRLTDSPACIVNDENAFKSGFCQNDEDGRTGSSLKVSRF